MEYRPEVREQLAIHGIRPNDTSSPELIRDYLSHLYRYEIRQLRARLLRGDIPRADYVTHVIRLRLRYPLLSIPTRLWTFQDGPGSAPMDDVHSTNFGSGPGGGRMLGGRVEQVGSLKEDLVLTVYGAEWCEDTQRSLRYLRRLGVAHVYRDVDADPAALDEAKALNHGKRRTPVVQVHGEVLVEPGNRTLTEALLRNGLIDRQDASERIGGQNVGDLERGIRIGAGVGLAVLALRAPRMLKIPLAMLGGWEVLTGVLGWCPVYSACGVTSLGGPLDHPIEADRESWLARQVDMAAQAVAVESKE